MEKFKIIARRAREPSTWAGIAVLLSLLGLPAPMVAAVAALLDVAPQLVDLVPALGAAGAAVLLSEKGGA